MPYVQVLIPQADWMTQMPPESARELALSLLACADAAETRLDSQQVRHCVCKCLLGGGFIERKC